jgi:hypothetical protein
MSSTVIRVGQAPETLTVSALYFDGISAQAQPVTLRVDEASQCLTWSKDDHTQSWPLKDVREVPDQANRKELVLRLRNNPVERLLVADRALAPRFPHLSRRAPVTNRWRLIRWGLAAVASVALIIFVLVPRMADQLAAFIPPEGERALGEATFQQIREALDATGMQPVPVCTAPAGRAALDSMTTKLMPDLPEGLAIHVLNHDMVNAFALPGGQIVVFEGLIRTAKTPEQLASVIGHEIGHVVSRDPTRHALRSAGSIGVLGLLFGDFAGGALVLVLTNQLINAQYSQTAEAEADVFAHDLLLGAGVAPSALGEMFEQFLALGGDAEGLMAHFMSHPKLGDRIENAQQATPEGFVSAPLLNEADWTALRRICSVTGQGPS